MRQSIKRLVAAGMFCAIVSATDAAHAQAPAPGNDVALGHELAIQLCTACHVVAARQPAPPILRDPAPSFAAVANRQGVSAAALKQFMMTTHTTVKNPLAMPNPQLVEYQVDPLVSYILSLRGQPIPAAPVTVQKPAPNPASDALYDRVLNQSNEAAPRSLDQSK